MKNRRFARGFTLIELFAVTAIVTAQASVLGPAVVRGNEKSRQKVCMLRMRHVGRAYMMYARDYGALVPAWAPGRSVTTPPPVDSGGTRIQWYVEGCWTWTELLQPYVAGRGGRQVFECPSAVYEYEPRDGHMRTSFKAVNLSADPNAIGTPPLSTLGWFKSVIPESAVARPNESIVLMDTKYLAGTMLWDTGGYFNMHRALADDWQLDTDPNYEAYRPHFSMTNFLFCDGHVDSAPYSKYARNRHWYIDEVLNVAYW